MQIIDAHVHLFPDPLFRAIWRWFDRNGWKVRYRVFSDELVRLLKGQGIGRFFLLNYAHKPGMSEALNVWTHEFSQKCPEAIPFGAVHPDDKEPARILDRCFRDFGFHGIKFHCHVTGIRPDDERMFPIYEKICEYDRLLTIHSGIGPSLKGYRETTRSISGASFTRNLLKRFGGLKVIVPHLGADEIDLFFDLMEEFPNLRLDTTMAFSHYFPLEIPWEKIERFSDRILYGSDFPNIPYEMSTEVNEIRASPLSEAAREKILFRNALELVGDAP